MINLQDRKDFLLDTGVSPGEDDSYDKQKAKLIAEHGAWIDNTKIPLLQRIEMLLQNARINEKPTGETDLGQFAQQTLAKSVPTPSEVNPINIIKSIPEVAKGVANVVRHPIAAAKQFALDPPPPSTFAAMALPGAALKVYRETVPIAARTYLHHMAGIPTPFTSVTEAERKALAEVAQFKIDKLMNQGEVVQKVNQTRAEILHNLKHIPDKELVQYALENGVISQSYVDHINARIIEGYPLTTKEYDGIRRMAVGVASRKYPREKLKTHVYKPEDRKNVAKDYENITSKQLKGFEIDPIMLDLNEFGKRYNFNSALGKTYVEPMVDKVTGRVIPKAIHDTYKFYPDVYGYDSGEARARLKEIFKDFDVAKTFGLTDRKYSIIDNLQFMFDNLVSMRAHDPLGIVSRKLGFNRPTSIIDIPLTDAPRKLNAYDKAAILLGGTPLAKERKK